MFYNSYRYFLPANLIKHTPQVAKLVATSEVSKTSEIATYQLTLDFLSCKESLL